jgi:hypothetical protein
MSISLQIIIIIIIIIIYYRKLQDVAEMDSDHNDSYIYSAAHRIQMASGNEILGASVPKNLH